MNLPLGAVIIRPERCASLQTPKKIADSSSTNQGQSKQKGSPIFIPEIANSLPTGPILVRKELANQNSNKIVVKPKLANQQSEQNDRLSDDPIIVIPEFANQQPEQQSSVLPSTSPSNKFVKVNYGCQPSGINLIKRFTSVACYN